jgi:hypothetical protein
MQNFASVFHSPAHRIAFVILLGLSLSPCKSAAALAAADHFPLNAGSTWTYKLAGNANETVVRTVVAQQKTKDIAWRPDERFAGRS